jgi:hypothetical protein
MRRFAGNSHRFLGFAWLLGLLDAPLGAAAETGAEARLPRCALLTRRGGMLSRSLFGCHRPTLARSLSFEGETKMSKGERHGNRETKKPKKDKIKTNAAAPSQKIASGQVSFSPGKKK